MQRVSRADAERALRPGADRRDADGFAPGRGQSSAQKLIAWESDRFDWLRPSGRSILTAEVATPSASSSAKSPAWSNCSLVAASRRHSAPAHDDRRHVRASDSRQRRECRRCPGLGVASFGPRFSPRTITASHSTPADVQTIVRPAGNRDCGRPVSQTCARLHEETEASQDQLNGKPDA